jgi:O-antigen biosynthesis protein
MEPRLVPYQAHPCIQAQSVLAFAPHADDEVFGCGGALAAHVALGHRVHVIVATDGAFACSPEKLAEVISTREAESEAAAAVLGYPKPEFWRIADRNLLSTADLVARVARAIEVHQPDLVYGTSLREMHPDHWHLAMTLRSALVQCARPGLRWASYEVGVPLAPNVLVDITPHAELKGLAMKCFASQLRQQRYDEHIQALNRFRSYTLAPEVLSVEAFHVVDSMALKSGVADGYETADQRLHRLGRLYGSMPSVS